MPRCLIPCSLFSMLVRMCRSVCLSQMRCLWRVWWLGGWMGVGEEGRQAVECESKSHTTSKSPPHPTHANPCEDFVDARF